MLNFLELTDRENDMVNTFSGGMMRRLEIAQALSIGRKFYFWMNRASGSTANARRIIWGLIKSCATKYNTTIMMTTHDMGEADELCDRIGIMTGGTWPLLGKPEGAKASRSAAILHQSIPAIRTAFQKLKEMGYSTITNFAGRPLRPGCK